MTALAFEGHIPPDHHDGPFLLILESDSRGVMYFGPFRTYESVERAAARCERIAGEALWSIEALQPGSFVPEWSRIIAEDAKAAND